MDGFIKIQKISSPIFNELGEEISIEEGFDDELIACKYFSQTNEIQQIGGGFFTQVKYIITTKKLNLVAQRIALFDRNKNLICEKDCQSVQNLHNIKRTRIVV